MQVYHIEPILL